MPEPHRLLIVDGQTLFRQGLRALLDLYPDLAVVGDAASVAEAHRCARELRPDVILMAAELPDGDGLEVTSHIKRELPQARVIILAHHEGEPELVYRALKAGAIGFASRVGGIDDLVGAIRSVAKGQAVVSSSALTNLVAYIGRTASAPLAEDAYPAESLSPREQEVLALVAAGLSNRQIADKLSISESTVHSHLHSILGKLNLANRVQAAAYVLSLPSFKPSERRP